MKAIISLDDVGGFKGHKEFKFESSALNIIEAPNSGGKSSLVKAIVGILSIPNDGKIDPYLLKEAKKLGIKSDELNTQEGFVNIHSEVGKVDLDLDGRKDVYEVKQNGDYLEIPRYGDQKFLLSGILSNDTKILRQLRNVDADSEPDDFKWAVTRLSKAKNYDEITDYLKIEKENFVRIETESNNTIKRTEKLRIEVLQLQEELKEVEADLLKLEPKFKGTAKLLNDRKSLIQSIEDLNKKIIQKKKLLDSDSEEILEKESILKKIIVEIKKYEKQLDELELFGQKIKDLKDSEIKDHKEKMISSINEEIANLKEERGKVDGVYNLFYLAQTSVQDKDITRCPLCDEGNITYDKLNHKIQELKEEKESISAKIMDKNQNIRLLDKQIEEIIKQRNNLFQLIQKNKVERANYEGRLEQDRTKLEHLEEDYEKDIKTKIEKEKKFEEIIKIIDVDDEEINKIYTDKEKQKTRLTEKIIVSNNEINSTTIEINGKRYNPDNAFQIAKKYIEILETLITYSKDMADKQREAAANRFNEAIKILMEQLDFEEFRVVKLNKDFRLYVERLDTRTHDYVSQLASTLSTSEKLTIALILQIALKETYLPHIPFFILDDVMEDFDDDRRTKIYRYLYNKAKEQNWIIISTKLNEDKTPIRVVNWTPRK